jgi:hypothetical protein
MLNDIKARLQNKNVLINLLVGVFIVIAIIYSVYLHINNAVSTENFLKEVSVYDNLSQLLSTGINFKDFDKNVQEVFGPKEDIRNSIIFKGTEGRTNPFSVEN